MKRILSLIIVALMLIPCASAFAEPVLYEECGVVLDFSEIIDKSENYPVLFDNGIENQDPYIADLEVIFYNLPGNVIETIDDIMKNTEDEAEYNDYAELLNAFSTTIAQIVVTNTETLAEAGAPESLLSKCEITELGTRGDYHYFFMAYPVDEFLAKYDEAEDTGDYEIPPQEMKEAALADIRMIQSELLKQVQASELSEPVNTDKEFLDKIIDFESVDLDGNVVRSADLFRDNKITMVNIWGTWCVNCMNEMGKLAEIHKRLQEKGCGIVGVEYERDSIENVADTARQVLADNGVTYPNVIIPEDDPIFSQVKSYPFSIFVDSEGKILTYPIKGAAVEEYEPTFEKLLAGDAVEKSPETGATENDSGEYHVFVYDTEGNPVKGVVVQMCDEISCSFQKTKEDGMAVFQVEAPKVYDVHLGKVPEGYVSNDEAYKTLDTFCDVNIYISKAE